MDMVNNGAEHDFSLTIDGVAAPAARWMDVVNPSTGEIYARAPNAGAEELDAAVAAAKKAFPKWKATPFAERRAMLLKAAEILGQNVDLLAGIFIGEHGRPLELIKGEIHGAVYWMQALCKFEIPVEITEDTETRRVEVHREPLGVVAGIVPWNYPILSGSWKVVHALLTGNVLVLKPSPFTSLATLKLGELWREVFPPGVLSVLSGDDALGPLMSAHPGFAKITFTGSSATGARIMASAAKDLKRLTMEMGGNDAAIVMGDVDPVKVAAKLFQGAFINTAQVCVATKRLYVHDAVYDRLRDELHRLMRAAKLGGGEVAGMDYGPIQNRPQFERVSKLLQGAKDAGLTLLQGQEAPEKGFFIPLTLVDNPPEDAPVVAQEAFGPILPMMRFTDVEEVLARANGIEFGLSASVWSGSLETGLLLAERMDVGTVWINDVLSSGPDTPLTGHKKSGFGVENGLAGLLEFTQIKAIFIPKQAA